MMPICLARRVDPSAVNQDDVAAKSGALSRM
jgi:hypothetical protein